MKTITLISISIACVVFLCSCTTKNSRPYSAKQTANILGKCFKAEFETINEEVIKQSPFAQTLYTLRKEPEGFVFTAVARVDYEGGIPIGRYIDANFTTALMIYHKEQVETLADKYALCVVLPESIDQKPVTKVYIHKAEQLKAVTDLFFDLQNLYDFNVSMRDYLTTSFVYGIATPYYNVYYLPTDDTDKENAKLIEDNNFWYRHADKKRDRELYERFNNPEIFQSNLEYWWSRHLSHP